MAPLRRKMFVDITNASILILLLQPYYEICDVRTVYEKLAHPIVCDAFVNERASKTFQWVSNWKNVISRLMVRHKLGILPFREIPCEIHIVPGVRQFVNPICANMLLDIGIVHDRKQVLEKSIGIF